MARPLRIEFPGGLYHVTSRGDRREAIFLCDADRAYWLDLLGEVCTRHNWLCHAYCFYATVSRVVKKRGIKSMNARPDPFLPVFVLI